MKYGSYINGEYQEAEDVYEVLNPYTGKVIAEVVAGDRIQMNKAIMSAHEAFKQMKKSRL